MNPVNRARSIDLINGTTAIPDRATFEHLSYQGKQVVIDFYLRDLEFVKFFLSTTWIPTGRGSIS